MPAYIPRRGAASPKVFYSVKTIALHMLAPGEQPTAKTRLLELSREGAQGVATAQTVRAMACGPELFELISNMARHGITAEDMEAMERLDHEITG